MKVCLGKHNLKRVEQGEQCLDIAEVKVYPGYNRRQNDKDFMLLRLRPCARLSETVKTINLPTSSPTDGSVCSVSGWGTIRSPQGKLANFRRWEGILTYLKNFLLLVLKFTAMCYSTSFFSIPFCLLGLFFSVSPLPLTIWCSTYLFQLSFQLSCSVQMSTLSQHHSVIWRIVVLLHRS